MINSQLQTGDLVIYRERKFGRQPAPHARNIAPSPKGDDYSYTVEKYLVVSEVSDDGTVIVTSASGTQLTISRDHPLLVRATWIQRLLYRSRFNKQPEIRDSDRRAA